VVLKENEDVKEYSTDLKSRGFEPEDRYNIINRKEEKKQLLDSNISI